MRSDNITVRTTAAIADYFGITESAFLQMREISPGFPAPCILVTGDGAECQGWDTRAVEEYIIKTSLDGLR
jgi:hypothetical protein